MKDVLFLIPLFYSANGVRRFHRYMEEEPRGRTYDAVFACSEPRILADACAVARAAGSICEERGNHGGGEGALWWLQARSGVDLTDYRYIWYFEESCEPVRRGWMDRLLRDMDGGVPLTGWWWSAEGRRRRHAIPHRITGAHGRTMTYYENTAATGADREARPLDGTWDTPGYRDETFVVRASDFLEFEYPDPRDPFWERWAGVRTYGVRAERVWWSAADVDRHGIPVPPPNIQWYVLRKHGFVPAGADAYRTYFRELPLKLRRDDGYRPLPIALRTILHAPNAYLIRATDRIARSLPWHQRFAGRRG